MISIKKLLNDKALLEQELARLEGRIALEKIQEAILQKKLDGLQSDIMNAESIRQKIIDKAKREAEAGTRPGPYHLTEEAVIAVERLTKVVDPESDDFYINETFILDNLHIAYDNPQMSRYQLSLAYRKLADCYLAHGLKEKALRIYGIALTMNPNLPVKRVVKTLETELLNSVINEVDV